MYSLIVQRTFDFTGDVEAAVWRGSSISAQLWSQGTRTQSVASLDPRFFWAYYLRNCANRQMEERSEQGVSSSQCKASTGHARLTRFLTGKTVRLEGSSTK